VLDDAGEVGDGIEEAIGDGDTVDVAFSWFSEVVGVTLEALNPSVDGSTCCAVELK
jgi:hypothetical protein